MIYMSKKRTYVRPHKRQNKKDKGTHRVKGHTRSLNSMRGKRDRNKRRLKGGARGNNRRERKYIKEIEEIGANVITDPEEIYWDDIYEKSIAMREGIDIRQKYKRKPILIKHDDEKIMIEWDYGGTRHDPPAWMIYNDKGDILGREDDKFLALMEVEYYLNGMEDW